MALTPEEAAELEQLEAVEGMGGAERFVRGFGQGAVRSVAGLGNMVGLMGDERLEKMDRDHAPIADTGWGQAGRVGGNIATFLVPGTAGARMLKGAGMLPGALRAAKVAMAAGEGALSSAAMAAPDEQGSAATSGAMWGGGMNAAGQLGGKLLRGAVGKSKAYKLLETETALANQRPGTIQRELFIPISQGADDSTMTGKLAKATYKRALPFFPGVEDRLNKQSKELAGTVGEVMMQRASPMGHTVPAWAASDVAEATDNIADAFGREYGKLSGIPVAVPKTFETDLLNRIRTSNPQLPPVRARQFVGEVKRLVSELSDASGGKSMDASNLKRLKGEVAELVSKNDEFGKYGDFYKGVVAEHVDDMFSRKWTRALQAGDTQTLEAIELYKQNEELWKNFAPMHAGAKKNKSLRDAINFKQIANRAAKGSDTEEIAQELNSVMQEKPVQISQIGRNMLNLGGAGALLASGGGLPGMAMYGGAVAGANALAGKGVQKALYGDTALQKRIAQLLLQNAGKVDVAGRAARGAVTGYTGDQY